MHVEVMQCRVKLVICSHVLAAIIAITAKVDGIVVGVPHGTGSALAYVAATECGTDLVVGMDRCSARVGDASTSAVSIQVVLSVIIVVSIYSMSVLRGGPNEASPS